MPTTPPIKIPLGPDARAFARLADYFGVWLIDPTRARGMASAARSISLDTHVRDAKAAPHSYAPHDTGPSRTPYIRHPSNAAIIPLTGVLMKHPSSMDKDATGLVHARAAVRAAARADDVETIVLLIDSPGGTLAGSGDLVDEVAKAASEKRVIAYAEDLAASAAYMVGCRATEFVCNKSAYIGSLGSYCVIEDSSEMAQAMGVKVHVLSTGGIKGQGVPGAPVSDEMLANVQGIADYAGQMLKQAVMDGRRMSGEAVDALMDGRVWPAPEAVSLGLVDAVTDWDGVEMMLRGESSTPATTPTGAVSPSTDRSLMMDDKNVTGAPDAASDSPAKLATLAELKKAIPDADAGFYVQALEAGMTVEEAQARHTDLRSAQLEAREEQVAKREQGLRLADRSDSDAVPDGTPSAAGGGSDDGGEFEELVNAKMAGGMKRPAAIAAVCRSRPDLHAEYVEHHNRQNGRRDAGAAFAKRFG